MAQDIAREIVAMQASKPALAFKVKVSPAKSLLLSTSMEGREKIYHLEVKEGNGSFAWKYKTLDAVVKYIRNCGVGGRATFKLVPSEGKSGIVLAELTWDTAFKTLAAFLQDKLELLEATT